MTVILDHVRLVNQGTEKEQGRRKYYQELISG